MPIARGCMWTSTGSQPACLFPRKARSRLGLPNACEWDVRHAQLGIARDCSEETTQKNYPIWPEKYPIRSFGPKILPVPNLKLCRWDCPTRAGLSVLALLQSSAPGGYIGGRRGCTFPVYRHGTVVGTTSCHYGNVPPILHGPYQGRHADRERAVAELPEKFCPWLDSCWRVLYYTTHGTVCDPGEVGRTVPADSP